ncbi:MAG: type I restriction enzyme HsdR N-terminal domain-containing protein [Armatimonadota bacterium]|nr:type I restriction enzyme HsdR N-terminal domain-containing protein [Armatimonadota bacterium]
MAGENEINRRIKNEIDRIKVLPQKPPNEFCTCFWVINPLLEAAGYEKHEIVLQGQTSAGTPDYTILPNTQWSWYLEAKSWDIELEKPHAIQAVNYANAQGKRWVVLSNGRQWHLYDNYLTGRAAEERLVVNVEINSPDFVDFLAALSKHSITSGELERYVVAKRIKDVLDSQLRDPSSEAVGRLTELLRSHGISEAEPEDVVAYFKPPLPPPPPPLPPNTYSLAELYKLRDKLSKFKPKSMEFPDGETCKVSTRHEVIRSIVKYLAEHNGLPEIPFAGGTEGKYWFIAREPVNCSGGRMKWPIKVDILPTPVYVEAGFLNKRVIAWLHALCQAAGEPPERFLITFSRSPIRTN